MAIQFFWGHSWQEVLNEIRRRKDLSARSWTMSTLRSSCQGTAGENTEGWISLSECYGELWSTEISGGSVITWSYDSWVYENYISNRNPVYSQHTPRTWQYFHTKNIEFFTNSLSSPVAIQTRYHSTLRKNFNATITRSYVGRPRAVVKRRAFR
jgi:hypothetical protein